MSAQVWDDRGVCDHATAVCGACGEVQWVWIAFVGYATGFQLCEPCLRDAVVVLDEHKSQSMGKT